MARYTVTAPDGQQYDVTAPDGATQDEVLAYAQANYRQAERPMTRLEQIERAFRNAHAQGATEDAQRLADAYRRERESAMPGQPIPESGSQVKHVQFPDGSVQTANSMIASGTMYLAIRLDRCRGAAT